MGCDWPIPLTEITEGDAVRRASRPSLVIGTRDILGLLPTVTRLLTELILGTGTVLELERGAITASCRACCTMWYWRAFCVRVRFGFDELTHGAAI